MKFASFAASALVALSVSPNETTMTRAVKHGDEYFTTLEGGRFWAFHSKGVSVVNPETCAIEYTMTKDANGNPLPTTWHDGVYMETLADRQLRQQTSNPQNGYVLVNSGLTRHDGHINEGGGHGEVFVFSTNPADRDQPVVSQIDIGGRPVHSYAVFTRDEYWARSDADGHFYIVHLGDLQAHNGKPVQAKIEEASHGNLLWDEDTTLRKHGFATSTGERLLFILDMENHSTVGSYNFNMDLDKPSSSCHGTHAIAYSGVNQHLYLECMGHGGALEFDVSNPETPIFVKQHLGVRGALYETPDGRYVVSSDKIHNKIHVLEPNGTGASSSIRVVVDTPGHPSTVSFYPTSDNTGDYIVCAPLTENTNQNHRYPNGNIACDFFGGCKGAATEADVQAGVCLYNDSGKRLLQVAKSEINRVLLEEAPFRQACRRCELEANFNEGPAGDPLCTCTPDCGSCAPSNYDDSNSGVRCFDMQKALSGATTEAALIPGAGAVFQGSPAHGGLPVCNFHPTYRTHKRGGKYDASIAHVPTSSLQIVDMSTQSAKCGVELPGTPSRVTYVPPQKGSVGDGESIPSSSSTSEDEAFATYENKANVDPLSGGAVAGIAIGSLVVLAAVALLLGGGLRRGAFAATTNGDGRIEGQEVADHTHLEIS